MLWSTLLAVVIEDVVCFYVLFEVMLLVMYACVSSYWYLSRSSYALYMLVIYTIVGSATMAVALLLHYVLHGVYSSPHSMEASSHSTLGVVATLMLHMGFYSKIPCYPLHH